VQAFVVMLAVVAHAMAMAMAMAYPLLLVPLVMKRVMVLRTMKARWEQWLGWTTSVNGCLGVWDLAERCGISKTSSVMGMIRSRVLRYREEVAVF